MSRLLKGIRSGLLLSSSVGADLAAGGGGGDNTAFLASLPEPLRGNEAFKDVKDAGDLATRYVDARTFKVPEKYAKADPSLNDFKSMDSVFDNLLSARKLVGMDKGRVALLPKDDKDEKGWNDFYAAQGRPEAADKYAVPPKRADGRDYAPEDKAFQAAVLPILHEAGLTQRQLERILPKWDELQAGLGKAHDEKLLGEQKAAGDALRKEWGANFDGNIGLADSAIQHLSKELKLGDGLAKALNASSLGNNPELARVFAHLGKQLKEDGLLGKGGENSGMNADTAKAEIQRMEGDGKILAVLRDKAHPDYVATKAKRDALYAAAYPEQEQSI